MTEKDAPSTFVPLTPPPSPPPNSPRRKLAETRCHLIYAPNLPGKSDVIVVSTRPVGRGERVRLGGPGPRGRPHHPLARGLQPPGGDRCSSRGRRGRGERRHEPNGRVFLCLCFFCVRKVKCRASRRVCLVIIQVSFLRNI